MKCCITFIVGSNPNTVRNVIFSSTIFRFWGKYERRRVNSIYVRFCMFGFMRLMVLFSRITTIGTKTAMCGKTRKIPHINLIRFSRKRSGKIHSKRRDIHRTFGDAVVILEIYI